MKFSIIFCLVAFFASQLVLADIYQDQMNSFKAEKSGEIQKLINGGSAQQKEKTLFCQVNFEVPAKNTVEKVCFPALAKCGKDVECQTSAVVTCKNQVQFIVDNTKKCITEKSY